MSTDLDNAQLAEMRDDLVEWSQRPTHSDEFRQACAAAAGLIADHLAGADNEAEAAPVLEAIFGQLAPAEIARLQSMTALHDAVDEAFVQGDFDAWRERFKELLDSLSEAHLEFLAEHFDSLGEAGDDNVLVLDPALVHAMPATAQ
jgi:hypothetical protein